MRRVLVILAILASAPAWAEPSCALPGPFQADAQLGPSTTPVRPAPVIMPDQGTPQPRVPTTPAPDAVAAIPFVQHLASSGARITDLGVSFGMRSVAARNGDQFMLFQIAPDGLAAVAGAAVDLTLPQLLTVAAGNVTELASLHGLKGFFVRNGAQFQVFYATPGEDRVIPGIMWGADGKDLTRPQVANIPGAIPTVVVGDIPAGPAADPEQTQVGAVTGGLALAQRANAGTVGQATAPHLWMLVDPQCVYSVRAYQMLRPFVDQGRLQISVIPLSVLDYEDKGQSTRSALALLSRSSDQIVSAWQAGAVTNPQTAEAAVRLRANMAIANAIKLKGTPTMLWRKPDGTEGRLDGLPSNVGMFVASIGE